jgi:hypothetical protein
MSGTFEPESQLEKNTAIWVTPAFEVIAMDAEIGSYQDEQDPID